MNLLNSGLLSTVNISKSYLLPCCHDVKNTLKYAMTRQEIKSPTMCKKGLLKYCVCKGQHPQLVPAQWTQVRFQNKYPRFHNDLNFPNMDHYRKNPFVDLCKTKWGMGDQKKGYTYTVGAASMIIGAYATKAIITQFITFMAAGPAVRAMASIEIDISKIAAGATATFKWRGKPLFVKNRSGADIAVEQNTPMNALKDPATPEERCQKPEWLIVIGICTHLGCIPVANTGDYAGGFYCPCHGSHYDNLGRIRKGPAPLNLEIPPYVFLSDTNVLVG